MVLEVGVVVCAIAGVAIMAAMAIAPYKCDLMFATPDVFRTAATLMPALGLLSPRQRLSSAEGGRGALLVRLVPPPQAWEIKGLAGRASA